MALSPEVRRGGGLPFGQFVSQWACDPRYSTNLRTLYTILITYADIGARDTSRGKPYRQELARQLGVSLSTLDRTNDEGEAAGLFRVQKRPDPSGVHDANVYHLNDAMFWRGEWTDPLRPGESAASAAKAARSARVAAKKAAGYVHKGGVPKGVKRGKSNETGGVASPMTPPQTEGGGVTHDARGGVTHDAPLASPVTPNVYSPVDSPLPEPSTPPVRPSVRVEDACVRETDGRTEPTGCDVGEEESQPSSVGEEAPADAVPNSGSNAGAASGAPGESAASDRELTPGESLLRRIGRHHPEIAAGLAQGTTLADQSRRVDGLLLSGVSSEEVRAVLVDRPYPAPEERTRSMAALIAGRLGKIIPPLGHRSGAHVPAQGSAPATSPDPVPPVKRLVDCEGRDGTCGRFALPGGTLCARCRDEKEPRCVGRCGSTVTTPGARCVPCQQADPPPPALTKCPGHNGQPCGRSPQAGGMCLRCRTAAERTRELDAELAARVAAVTAMTDAERAAAEERMRAGASPF